MFVAFSIIPVNVGIIVSSPVRPDTVVFKLVRYSTSSNILVILSSLRSIVVVYADSSLRFVIASSTADNLVIYVFKSIPSNTSLSPLSVSNLRPLYLLK